MERVIRTLLAVTLPFGQLAWPGPASARPTMLRPEPDKAGLEEALAPLSPAAQALDRRLRETAPAGLEEPGFISQDPTRSEVLRNQYRTGVLATEAFVNQVLAPVREPLVASDELVVAPAAYRPSPLTAGGPPDRRGAIQAQGDYSVRVLLADGRLNAQEARSARAAVEALLRALPPETSDNEAVEQMLEVLRVATGVLDPLETVKQAANREALRHLPAMGERVSSDLARAMALGILGNGWDLASQPERERIVAEGFGVQAALDRVEPLARQLTDQEAYAIFVSALAESPNGPVLFLVDNAGEIVFDLPLIKLLAGQGRPVILVGKSLPHANDMTAEDLRQFLQAPPVREYLGAAARGRVSVIASGTAMTGLDLRRATPELIRAWQPAAIIYAKGQGMVETLRHAGSPLTRDVYHAVLVKDPAYFAAEPVQVQRGDPLFLRTAA